MMRHHEIPCYKAMYFDLKFQALKKYYSPTNPNGGYYKIQNFMEHNGFEHEQYSGYHSKKEITDLMVFKLFDDMQLRLPWLSKCARKFEVTNIGENYDLTRLFPEIEV